MQCTNDVDLALQAIFLNRTAYSGMLNAGPIGGKRQDGKTKITDRYNYKVLKEKILNCNRLLADRTEVTCEDFRTVLSTTCGQHMATYLDPPYILEKGNKLYPVGMSYDDHRALADILNDRDNWLLSYDDCELSRSLYLPEEISTVPVRYCIANDWGGKRELLIGKGGSGKKLENWPTPE